MRFRSIVGSLLFAALVAGCGTPGTSTGLGLQGGAGSGAGQGGSAGLAQLPQSVKVPSHIVIVVEENHSFAQIAGNPNAPYINSLMKEGANFTNYHGVEHPSQPNYLDLFSGSNQGITSDSCPNTISAPNLGTQLLGKGLSLSFKGYSEGLPSVGYTGCSVGGGAMGSAAYARKHNPWVNFSNLPADVNQPFSNFPKDYAQLPTVSFVIPNLNHDMHNGTVKAADTWLQQNLGAYVQWAKTHNSMLVVTWDENNGLAGNHIPTVIVGPMVKPGDYSERLNHFNLLRTIESFYGLPGLGKSRSVSPITNIWN